MLDPNEAHEAIRYFYKDFDTLQIGNPLPFVATYDKDTQILFNELMFDGVAKNIFYGTVTWTLASTDASATTTRVALTAYKNPDGSTSIVPFDISAFFDALPTPPDFKQGITQGLFCQQIVLVENARISFDGYIFKLEKTV